MPRCILAYGDGHRGLQSCQRGRQGLGDHWGCLAEVGGSAVLASWSMEPKLPVCVGKCLFPVGFELSGWLSWALGLTPLKIRLSEVGSTGHQRVRDADG